MQILFGQMYPIGGWTSFIGGFLGYYLQYQQNQTSRCVLNCPDPWGTAVIFAIPGVLIVAVKFLIGLFKKS
jgi:hypothetical protein